MSTIINTKSTKEAIITAAEELIADRERQLSTQTKLSKALREERNTLVALLAATSAYGFLF